MDKTKKIPIIILLAISVLTGCAQKDTTLQTNNNTQQEQSGTEKEVTTLKSKYSATDFYTDDIKFSAELIDEYKGQNLYVLIPNIDDVFYSNGELFMYVSHWGNEHFLLKITPEQYAMIQKLDNSSVFNLHIIFRLADVESTIPSMSTNFYFDIRYPDDVLVDEESSLSFHSRIIKGELIDIIELRNQD